MPFTDKTAEDSGKGFQILGAKKESQTPSGDTTEPTTTIEEPKE